jgi:hypothetical protein
MNPKNVLQTINLRFVWVKEYCSTKGKHGARAFMKRKCRRVVRRDGKNQIKLELDNSIAFA